MKRKKIGERSFWYFLFMLPNLLLYGIFGIFPIALGIFYSFTDWNGIAKSWKMVGLGNYIKMLHDSRFLRAMRFNLTYTLLLVVIVIALAMILAVMMDKMKWGKTFFRAVYFIPAVLSLLTVGIIFEKIYGTVLPAMGAYLEIDFLKKNILASAATARYGILITHVWQGVVLPTVLLTAGLQTVPQELTEAAYIDGATRWQAFRTITIPFLLPILSVVLVLVLKDGLMLYDYVYALTSGGPGGATESITMLVYKQGFQEMKFSYALAEAVAIAAVMIGISILQTALAERKKVY